jgi:hypothetical protein
VSYIAKEELTGSDSWSITLGSGTIVHTPRIPKDDIPRSSFDLLPSTSSVEEPLFLLLCEMMRITPCPPLGRSFMFMSLEEFII